MKLRLTLLTALGCLLLTTSCKDPEDNNSLYATNKAGERLVEKITFNDSTSISFSYNSDGFIRKIIGKEGNSALRTLSFEMINNTLYMTLSENYNESQYTAESSFDLNTNGFIVRERGWEGKDNYRLTYDESEKYLQKVFNGDELLWTFQWEDGNILNEEVTYTMQSHPSNIDWCAYFQTWRRSDDATDVLLNMPSICEFWGFSGGYLGNKCMSLPIETGKYNYNYDFYGDGFVSTIYETSKFGEYSRKMQISYVKK